jgi:hypothetical protein
MITNTCLIGGSPVAAAPGADWPPFADDDPPSEPALPEDPELAGGEVAAELDEPEEDAGVAGAAGLGVGVDSAAGGGSLVDSAGGDVCAGAAVAARGMTTLRGERAEAANVSRARDPAAPPRITPKPRNTSTSSADTRGEGSVNPSANREGPRRAEVRGSSGPAGPGGPGRPAEPGGPGDPLESMGASGARRARPRRSSSTS